jgi:hypothetical protein
VRFVDQYPKFVSSSGAVLDARLPDNVHPDEAGYSYMADAWYNALKSLPAYRPTSAALMSSAEFDAPASEPLPEPGGLTTAACGLVLLLARRRRRRPLLLSRNSVGVAGRAQQRLSVGFG